ncbi:unnamed protein product [Wuchereria bancrofti]|uniref:Uncharacterized protein n=1 Tax=Wuchereria bancrofti TaxID=6293 RepID=A0A3P7G0N3_WUCBA|nr:unnamed protein product [Wuchereria bancrofti]
MQMQREGTSEKDACKRIFLISSKGLITVNSPVVKSEASKIRQRNGTYEGFARGWLIHSNESLNLIIFTDHRKSTANRYYRCINRSWCIF